MALGPRVLEEHAELEEQVVDREPLLHPLLTLRLQLLQPLRLGLGKSAAVVDWLGELSVYLGITVSVVHPNLCRCHVPYITESSLPGKIRTKVETLRTVGCDNSFCIPSIDDLGIPEMMLLLT